VRFACHCEVRNRYLRTYLAPRLFRPMQAKLCNIGDLPLTRPTVTQTRASTSMLPSNLFLGEPVCLQASNLLCVLDEFSTKLLRVHSVCLVLQSILARIVGSRASCPENTEQLQASRGNQPPACHWYIELEHPGIRCDFQRRLIQRSPKAALRSNWRTTTLAWCNTNG
jgi:hypothetical protein